MSMSLTNATFKFTPPLVSPVSPLRTRSVSIRCEANRTNYTSDSPIPKVVVPFVNPRGLDWVSAGRVSSRNILCCINRQEICTYFTTFNPMIGFSDISIFISSIICWMLLSNLFLRKMYTYGSKDIPFERSLWRAPGESELFFRAFLLTFQVVWVIHRCNARGQQTTLLALDKLPFLSMLVLVMVGVAEASGLPKKSILAIGGIGGIVTAIAAIDIIENVLGGLFLLISLPFSIGDTITVGSCEGQVIEMGLTTITLLNKKQFPVVISNSIIHSQVIVNHSRAGWHAISTKILVQVDDFNKIRLVSEVIKSMLERNENVFLGKEPPYCYLSTINEKNSELTMGCNVKKMIKHKMFAFKQEIMLQVVETLKSHGVKVGGA